MSLSFKHVLLILMFYGFYCAAQGPRPSLYEWRWAFCHPVAAIKVKSITKKCAAIALPSAQLDSFNNGGKLDAYRHCFYMAAYAQKIKTKKLRKLGRAHEKANYRQFLKSGLEEGELPDSLSSVMDLFNNELGLKLGAENKKTDRHQLSSLVVTEINKGNALIMARDARGNYVDCSGKKISLRDFRGRWLIPKCLKPSH